MDMSRNEAAADPLARALRLLERTPLVDGHNDLPFLLRQAEAGKVPAYDIRARNDRHDTDLPRLAEGRVSAQFWAAFVPPRESKPASYALQQIALIRRMTARNADALLPATRASDIARAKTQKKIASFVAIENGAALESRLNTLHAFHDLGVRLMTLCHNATTEWCDSATDTARHGGLTEFGRTVVTEMNRIGMLVDLAHVSDAVMHQVLDVSRAPVVFSHSNARALCNHPRNVPDDVLARIRPNGGIVMATFVPRFISTGAGEQPQPGSGPTGNTERTGPSPVRDAPKPLPAGTLSQLCDHLDYLARKAGHDHIGVGSDFFGGPQGEGLEDVTCFPHLFAELIRRGWSERNLRKLASGNFVRVFRDAERVALS
jgi:membrane dipeptidase